MYKITLCFSILFSLSFAHDSHNVSISISQTVNGIRMPSSSSHLSSDYASESSESEYVPPYKKDGFNIEDYRDVDYPFVQPENKDYVCTYWSCREYPCRCMDKEPRCPENYVWEGKCKPTDVCLKEFKGCGAGELFSYETCSCECFVECASDEIRLPGVCLCGKGTFPVYNEWAVGRYFGEKKNSTGFNK